MLAENLKIEKLPLLSPCYCSECKAPLHTNQVVDSQNAWCSDCEKMVATSAFQVEGWAVGVTTVLALSYYLL